MSAQRGASSDCCVRCVNWTLVQTMNGRVTRVPCHYASWDYWSVGICYQERRCSARTRSGRTGSIGNQVCAWPLPLFPILYPLSHRPRRWSKGRGGLIFYRSRGRRRGGGTVSSSVLPFEHLSSDLWSGAIRSFFWVSSCAMELDDSTRSDGCFSEYPNTPITPPP